MLILQNRCNDRRADLVCSIDDFLKLCQKGIYINSRYTLSDIHAGDTCEVESLQGHLRGGFANTLSRHCSDRFAWSDQGLRVFFPQLFEKQFKLILSQRRNVFDNGFERNPGIETIEHFTFPIPRPVRRKTPSPIA